MFSKISIRRRILACMLAAVLPAAAQRQLETLDRGLIAIRQGADQVYLGWRLLGTDPATTAFNLYRVTAGETQRVNPEPLTGATNLLDDNATNATGYFVRNLTGTQEGAPSATVSVMENAYLEIPLKPLDDYRPGDASTGDLDGDGQYEIILHRTSKGRDNSFAGITGTPVLEAYKLDGSFLWRIDLGINIREGEHYTQFIVYDLDGDGRAEIACKTADGTKDGVGKILGDPNKDWREKNRLENRGLHSRPRSDRRLGRHRRQWRQRFVWQPQRPLPRLRRLSRWQAPEPGHVPRRLWPQRARRLGLARRRTDIPLGFRFRHQPSALCRCLALLRHGRPLAFRRGRG